MLKSILNIINQNHSNNNKKDSEEDLIFVSGILVEAAAIDGKIEENEILKVNNSLINFFGVSKKKSEDIVKMSIENINEPNSFHYFTSKINEKFGHHKKIILIEMLWEIILADGKVHDFESSLIRRIAGLLYVSDIDCGNAKKRILKKLS